jgi:hypothetical protein
MRLDGKDSLASAQLRREYDKDTNRFRRVQANYVLLITHMPYMPKENFDKYEAINPEYMLECVDKKWMDTEEIKQERRKAN